MASALCLIGVLHEQRPFFFCRHGLHRFAFNRRSMFYAIKRRCPRTDEDQVILNFAVEKSTGLSDL